MASESHPSSGGPAAPELDLIPSLKRVVEIAGLNPQKLTLTFEADGQGHIQLIDKHSLALSDGEKLTSWQVPLLSELFRGNREPPPDIEKYPPEYAVHFFAIENQVLTLCDGIKDRTDQELEEIYSAIRRRPDGRSLGIAHDFIWQVLALLLGQYALSQPEFEGILGALVRSTRRWSVRPVSRNYVNYLRQTFGQHHSSSLAQVRSRPN